MLSRWSIRSRRSLLSIASTDSVLSIGSVGSVLSIGSVGSFGSVGSCASAMSMLSAGSYQSQGSVLSGQSDGSILSWQSTHSLHGRHTDGRLDPTILGSVVAGATALAAIRWLVARPADRRAHWTSLGCGRVEPTPDIRQR
jgi:hypothetical protein